MTIQEKNKKQIRELIDEANKGNIHIFWKAVSPDCMLLDNFGKKYTKEQYIQFMEVYDDAVPDYQMVIEDLIAEDDKVVVRYTETGTLEKNVLGLEASGKSYEVPGIEIYRFVDGKITEIWMARDTLAVGMQAEAIPLLTKIIYPNEEQTG